MMGKKKSFIIFPTAPIHFPQEEVKVTSQGLAFIGSKNLEISLQELAATHVSLLQFLQLPL